MTHLAANPTTELTTLTLGFVPIARPTFDVPLAESVTGQARAALEAAGFTLAGPDALIMTLEQAEATAQTLADQPLDALVVFQASFADSTMIMALADVCDAPLVLWAIPEERTGERLRLNSLCGINLAGHALTRAGRAYSTIYDAPDSPAARPVIDTAARAGRARRLLNGARIGRVGEHPDGFETCDYDTQSLAQTFGVRVEPIALETVFDGARQADPARVAAVVDQLGTRIGGLDTMDQSAVRGTVGSYLTLRALADEHHMAGMAVRCWPQFFTDLGCAACGALSMMNDDLLPAACEADINGTVTQIMLQAISGGPAFGADIVSFDRDADNAVLWHCGKAPLAMCDPAFAPRATIHSNRRLPLLMEFPLKPGRVTLARLSEATGGYRLVVGGGEVLRAPLSYSGTSGVIRFDRPAADVLETLLGEGLEHHVALTYGDYVPALLTLADMLKLPVLHL